MGIHPYNASGVASVIVKEMVKLGIPRSIVSDRDKVLRYHFWKELFRLQGTYLGRSTVDQPLMSWQMKVVNRFVEEYLWSFTYDKPRDCYKWSPWAEYWYNTTFHASTNATLFRAVYGRDPPPLIQDGIKQTSMSIVEQ